MNFLDFKKEYTKSNKDCLWNVLRMYGVNQEFNEARILPKLCHNVFMES